MVINPIAGIGGAVGLKGSDGIAVQNRALKRGAVKKAETRAMTALSAILELKADVTVYAAAGEMGENLAKKLGFETVTVGAPALRTSGADTRFAVKHLAPSVDVLLFAGGDGTARDVCAAAPKDLLVIGVPAGVKIHSAVYAVSPEAAGRALRAGLASSIPAHQADVMDIDETVYRSGRLQARLYGYLKVPVLHGLMQHPKAASFHQGNDISGICEEIKDFIRKNDPGDCYIFGAGSTVIEVEKALGVEGTLLGIDVFRNGRLVAKDVSEKDLLAIACRYRCHIVITAIGGQGHIFGRGNQQLSPAVIRQVGVENVLVVAAASKIYALPDQSLYVDTGNEALDEMLRGYRKIIIGWQESLVCRVQ